MVWQEFHFRQTGRALKWELYDTRNLGARWAPISSWWPSGLLDFVFHALRALKPCDPRRWQVHLSFGASKISGARGTMPFWVILGHFGSFWTILGHFGPFWAILGHFGPFWVILGHLVEFWLQKHHLHCIVKFKKNAPNLDFLCRE